LTFFYNLTIFLKALLAASVQFVDIMAWYIESQFDSIYFAVKHENHSRERNSL